MRASEILRRRRDGDGPPAKQYRLVREVSSDECPWLMVALAREFLTVGTVVCKFTGPTYGCVNEFAATLSHDGVTGPFFELPFDSIEEI